METIILQKTTVWKKNSLQSTTYILSDKQYNFTRILFFCFPDWPAGRLCESGWDLWLGWEVQNFSGGPGLFSGHQLQPGGCCSQAQGVLSRWHRRLLRQRRRRHQRYCDLSGAAARSVSAPFVLCSRLLPRSAELDAHVGSESHIISEQALHLEHADPANPPLTPRWMIAATWSCVGRSRSTTRTCPTRRPWARRPRKPCRRRTSPGSASCCSATWTKQGRRCASSASGSDRAKLRWGVNIWHVVRLLVLPSMHFKLSVPDAGAGNCGERHRENGR